MLSQIRPVGNKIRLKHKKFKSCLFAPFIFSGYQSGTAALAAALVCVKQQQTHTKSPEVLLPAYACPDLISACLFANIKPVLVDFQENTPWMSLEDLTSKVNANTISVIAVNFLGIPERIQEIRQATQKSNLLIIEDSAQGIPKTSPGDYWKGDLIITSFGRGKPLSLFGGGAVLYTNQAYSEYLPVGDTIPETSLERWIYRFKVFLINFLSTPFLYYVLTRLPFLNLGKTHFKPLVAINGLSNHIKNYLTYNKQNYESLRLLNHEISAMINSIDCDYIINLPRACNLKPDYPLLRYPLLITDLDLKNKIAKSLEAQGLGISYMYQKPLVNIEGIPKAAQLKGQTNPIAEKFAGQLITLPTHTGVNKKIIKEIKKAIVSAIKTS